MTVHGPDSDRNSQRSDLYWRWTLVVGLGLLIAVSAFGAGILAERDLFANDTGIAASSGGNSFDRLGEVRNLVEREYFARPSTDAERTDFERNLEYGAIQGMLGTLDSYSAFLVPVDQSSLKEKLDGEYQGIGVWVEFPDGVATIVAPMPGSPAESAGLLPGDAIVAVDGHPLTNVEGEDALALVRGPEDSTVTVTIRRAGVADTFDVSVKRQRIPIHSVSYVHLPKTNTAWITVTVFGDKTTSELDAALKQAQADQVAGIVLDLRNNGGGWVQSAQEMIGRFVPASAGPALYEDQRPDGSQRASEPIISGDISMFATPLVVLVNKGSASASEIVTGALRDYGRARVVGETTYGKGSVQRVHDFDDGSSARITFAEWLTPSLQRIQAQGIAPDVTVAVDPSGKTDAQLDAAIAALSSPGAATPAAVLATPQATPAP